jgi:hypothetical protein
MTHARAGYNHVDLLIKGGRAAVDSAFLECLSFKGTEEAPYASTKELHILSPPVEDAHVLNALHFIWDASHVKVKKMTVNLRSVISKFDSR